MENTLSLCPKCRKIISAKIINKNGNLYMSKKCDEHGNFNSLYWKDSEIYNFIRKRMPKHNICEAPKCIKYNPCNNHYKKSTTIMIHLTDRCNFSCPICFSDSNNILYKEPTIEDIKNGLPEVRNRSKMNVVLIGGEPTLREDLPEIIRIVKEKGYYPRLSTNGSALANKTFLKKLKDAGLEWIILQFDGFTEEINKQLRGKKLLSMREKLIDSLEESGFKIHLAVMTSKNINIDSVWDIVNYSINKKAIIWISFYPCSNINRNNLRVEDTHIIDVIKSLDKSTNSKIGKKDFKNMIRIMNLLYLFSKKEIFRIKVTTLPIILISDKFGIYPITKLINPFFFLKKISLSLKTLLNFKKIIRFQGIDIPLNILFLVIEKFHNYTDIDFKEASNCHMCYMVKKGFVAFDTFNALYRKKKLW